MHRTVPDVLTVVADSVAYINETQKAIEKNQKKLEEITNDIRAIHTGKNIICFHFGLNEAKTDWLYIVPQTR